MTRKEAIKELKKWRNSFNYDYGDYNYGDDTTKHALDFAIEELDHPDMFTTEFVEDLPPVNSQSKTGHWRHYEGMLICSECGTEFYDDIMEYCGDDVPKFCPNCGAKMAEP